MLKFYNQLSNNTKGIISMAIGAVLLLHTLGVFTVLLSWVLVIISLALIVSGFMESDFYEEVMKRINKKR